MLDLFNVPYSAQTSQVFYANSGSWQLWQKPRGAKMIYMFCLGSGAGGAGGFAGNGGGKGGGGGAIVQGIIPAFLLPDTLYVRVAIRGTATGQGAGSAGGDGSHSYIALGPLLASASIILQSSTIAARGGAGTANTGQGGTVINLANYAFSSLGIFNAIAGVSGSNGGNAVGTSQPVLATTVVTGGAGGGGRISGVPQVGGSITSASAVLTANVIGGTAGTAGTPAGGAGNSGYYSMYPFCSAGGAGGGGATGSVARGGRGGNGSFGSGGGGGGVGNSNSLDGGGGDGGDGLVIITTIY